MSLAPGLWEQQRTEAPGHSLLEWPLQAVLRPWVFLGPGSSWNLEGLGSFMELPALLQLAV